MSTGKQSRPVRLPQAASPNFRARGDVAMPMPKTWRVAALSERKDSGEPLVWLIRSAFVLKNLRDGCARCAVPPSTSGTVAHPFAPWHISAPSNRSKEQLDATMAPAKLALSEEGGGRPDLPALLPVRHRCARTSGGGASLSQRTASPSDVIGCLASCGSSFSPCTAHRIRTGPRADVAIARSFEIISPRVRMHNSPARTSVGPRHSMVGVPSAERCTSSFLVEIERSGAEVRRWEGGGAVRPN
eukprot:scaffold138548_cov24-Tisochrysis_lutea.AAC.1